MATVLPKIYYSFGLDEFLAIPSRRELSLSTLRLEENSGVVLSDKYDRGVHNYAVICRKDETGRLVYNLLQSDKPKSKVIITAADLETIGREYALRRVTSMWERGALPSGLERLEDVESLQQEIYSDAMWSSLDADDEETLEEFLSYENPRNTKPVRKFSKTT